MIRRLSKKLNNPFKKFTARSILWLFIIIGSTLSLVASFVSKEALETEICKSSGDGCAEGCEAPTMLSGNCPSTIWKDDATGLCYRKCPYVCIDPEGTGCKYNKCCGNCGDVNIAVDCSNQGLSEDYVSSTVPSSSLMSAYQGEMESEKYFANHDIDESEYLCRLNLSGKDEVCGPLASNEWVTWFDIIRNK